jgi:general secretion pathway protein K
MKRNLGSDRGFALVVVLFAVTLIVAVTVEFNRSARSEVYDAANFRDRISLVYAAKSGVAEGLARLLADEKATGALTEDWAKPFAEEEINNVQVAVRLEDEGGKILVNRLVTGKEYNQDLRQMLLRLLAEPEFGLDAERIDTIVSSLKDWIDEDNEVTPGGAENATYLGLPRPYAAKNAPLDCLEEMLMIKGVTKELYYGTEDTPGLRDVLTVHGDGKININTAPTAVLRALSPDVSLAMAQQLDDYRRSPANSLASIEWYKNAPGWSRVSLKADLVRNRSDMYRITATGRLGEMRERVSRVLTWNRENKKLTLLGWEQE